MLPPIKPKYYNYVFTEPCNKIIYHWKTQQTFKGYWTLITSGIYRESEQKWPEMVEYYNLWNPGYYHVQPDHFMDEVSEAQRWKGTWPKSHKKLVPFSHSLFWGLTIHCFIRKVCIGKVAPHSEQISIIIAKIMVAFTMYQILD